MTDKDDLRWVFDPDDSLAHVLADLTTAEQPDMLITICERELPTDHTPRFPAPPSPAIYPVCPRSGRPGHRTSTPNIEK